MYNIVKTKKSVVDGIEVWIKKDIPSSKAATLQQGAAICSALNDKAEEDECYHLELID